MNQGPEDKREYQKENNVHAQNLGVARGLDAQQGFDPQRPTGVKVIAQYC